PLLTLLHRPHNICTVPPSPLHNTLSLLDALPIWAPSHGASPAVRVLCERIVVAQNDEIAFAQRWLREHQEFVPPADPRGHVMPGMDHPMLMPGMLTPDQMTQLDAAHGREFDRLFLTFMIQHHQGA